ncbi:16S rRNA (cytosine(1402)-N(4))-methyltransferase RsmH [Nitratireductor sp. ZSWI3]|uniref:16S rRNA (cytosine(1402)-N(4))-methyltransferase RsmH n=1 Tax=Nitratireductor sp. ZSWI3 TaxID=2966359 RepID=UPI0021502DD5|nr:16S rRNA (cytosine(1402)-N(4))-methyltransferase RsmH [Nitratireductor sp. ZSWI3]MCR4266057.1 16S rRNA (cytosine(1402)-N(4))-methyltransferase RsmH [Nitratireductor sp. ZSWI3]
MMADPGGSGQTGGGPVRHIPVLLDEVLEALRPLDGRRFVDGTFGAGGYTTALLKAGASVVAIDRDPTAIEAGQALAAQWGERLRLVEDRFSNLDMVAGEPVDGVVLDIGVSSMQIDQAVRGFSFQKAGPLDMRMEAKGPTAADVVNTMKAGDLTRIFGILGEERQAGRIARGLEKMRADRPFETTLDLANAVEKIVGRRPQEKIHPATRVFQALRIFVNDELGELARALFAAERILKPGGRLVVVTFHSLEDRIVKRFLTERAGGQGGSRHLPEVTAAAATFEKPAKSVAPTKEEAARNPRARSARLRLAVRTGAPTGAVDFELVGLSRFPRLPGAQER